jgi:hypothetical protein
MELRLSGVIQSIPEDEETNVSETNYNLHIKDNQI